MTRSRKPPSRLFVDDPLAGPRLKLDADQAHYLGRVLRCREGEPITVFNAQGEERSATIESLAKRHPVLALGARVAPLPESPARIILLQALVKSDAMDLIIQKATELGVAAVFAAKTDFSVIRLDAARKLNRLTHWRRIARSACEQSGRHRPPELHIFDSLDAATAALPDDCERIAFDTDASGPLDARENPPGGVCVAIGPEGGFSPSESDWLAAAGFRLATLGPRTLRAETAAIAACTGLQFLRGDLGGS
jgi:16S rRNA (uracil1498-N3)-methyltransferase